MRQPRTAFCLHVLSSHFILTSALPPRMHRPPHRLGGNKIAFLIRTELVSRTPMLICTFCVPTRRRFRRMRSACRRVAVLILLPFLACTQCIDMRPFVVRRWARSPVICCETIDPPPCTGSLDPGLRCIISLLTPLLLCSDARGSRVRSADHFSLSLQ